MQIKSSHFSLVFWKPYLCWCFASERLHKRIPCSSHWFRFVFLAFVSSLPSAHRSVPLRPLRQFPIYLHVHLPAGQPYNRISKFMANVVWMCIHSWRRKNKNMGPFCSNWFWLFDKTFVECSGLSFNVRVSQSLWRSRYETSGQSEDFMYRM